MVSVEFLTWVKTFFPNSLSESARNQSEVIKSEMRGWRWPLTPELIKTQGFYKSTTRGRCRAWSRPRFDHIPRINGSVFMDLFSSYTGISESWFHTMNQRRVDLKPTASRNQKKPQSSKEKGCLLEEGGVQVDCGLTFKLCYRPKYKTILIGTLIIVMFLIIHGLRTVK